MSTSLDRNIDSLANIIMQRRQMQAQQVQQDRANRLSDLQFKQLQREDDYQTGLRDAMSNPGGSGVTLSQLQPPQPQQNTLASLAPGNQLPFPQPQASFAPVEAKMSPEQAGIEYARKNNRPKDALELIDLNKKMLDHAAQLKVYGGEEQAAQVRAEVEKMTTGTSMFSSWKKAGGLQYAKQMAAQFPQMFGGDSMANVNDSNGINEYKLDNGQTVVWSDDNPGQLHLTSAPKPDQEAMIDKRFANQQKLTQMQIDAQDRSAAADRAAAERRAAGKADPADAIVAREVVKDLPRLRREARTAEASKPRIAQMVSLLDNGAGGLKGNALAAVSGVFDTPATSEAELFKKLAAAGAGQLRTAVIGPGAVSNYEQSLLQAISGGGNGARTATRQLLKFYEQEADRTIANYNDAVDSAVTVAPKAAKGFGRLGGTASPAAKGKDTRPPLSAIFGTKKR